MPTGSSTRHEPDAGGTRAQRLADDGGRDTPVRHPGDIVRVTAGLLVFAACAAAARGGAVAPFERNVFRLVNELPAVLTLPLIAAMQAGSLAAVFVTGGLALAARRRCLARDLLVSGTLAWLAAKGAKLIVYRGRPSALLAGVLIRGARASGLGFPSGHAAVAAALATAIAPYLGRRARRFAWCGVGIVAVARVYVGAHFPLDVIGGGALGWAIGSGVHLVWGAPGGRPALDAVRQGLQQAGINVTVLRPLAADARGSVPFLARDGAGAALFVKVVGHAQRDADWLYRAWRYLAYREAGDEPPFPAPKQIIEHEALLSMLALRGGVRTPALVAVSALPDRSGVLVCERVSGKPIGQAGPLTDDVLSDIWQQVTRLRAVRIGHRDLRQANILVDGDCLPWIIDFGFGQAAASDGVLAQDVAELLTSLALVVGAKRAVAAASSALGKENLRAVLPLLQPLALSTATRRELRAHPDLLAELRRKLAACLGLQTEPPPRQLLRVTPKALLILVAAALAAHLIVAQVTELHQIGHALSRARWDWLAAAAIASTFTYLMAAAAVAGAAGRRLPFGRIVLVQLVSSVANRLTPGGTGGVGVNIRYLQRSGLTTPESVAAVTLANVAGFIVHVLALAAVAGLLAGRAVEPIRLPHRGAVLIVFLAVTTLAGALFWSPLGRARVLPAARQAAQSLLAALRHPTQAILVLGGAAGVTASYVLALLCSLRAFGATPPLLDVAAAYLVGAAIGAASPTPGGLGAIEAALVAVLLHFGVPGGPAVTGVLAFRLVTYWLPILPGVPAARALRRDGVL